MDDTFSLERAFGGTTPKTPVEEAWHNEQKRKQYDIIRVKNPTAQDFYVMYDVNQHQKVPANSTIDVPRYIAVRYVEHMKDHLINEMAQKKHDDYMKERREKGHPDFKSKWEENEETYLSATYPKTNDEGLIAEVTDTLWIGLVHEFGRDVPPQNMDSRAGEVDLTPPMMRVLENLEKRRAPLEPEAPVSQPPTTNFSAMHARLSADEVTTNE